MRKINRIFWHCSATPEGRDVSFETIRGWHVDPKPKGNGWSDIGYHFLYLLDGTEVAGRPIERQGAGVRGHNEHSIHLCYVGGMTGDNVAPKDTRTPEQREAMYKRTEQLLEQFPGAEVAGHNQFDNKACPSFNAPEDWQRHLDNDSAPDTDPGGHRCPHCGEPLCVTVSS